MILKPFKVHSPDGNTFYEGDATQSPIGEDAANGVDETCGHIARNNWSDGSVTCRDCNATLSPVDAAKGAIGEREAFEAWARDEPFDLTRSGTLYTNGETSAAWHGWRNRAALPAEKVAAEPTSIPFSAYRLKVAEECCERLMSACTDSGCPDGVNMADWIRQLAAPQQPAQSAEQGERSTGICFFCGEPIDGQHESDCPQSTATQPVQPQVALRCCRMGCDKPSICERLGECRISAAAQPVSGGKS